MGTKKITLKINDLSDKNEILWQYIIKVFVLPKPNIHIISHYTTNGLSSFTDKGKIQ